MGNDNVKDYPPYLDYPKPRKPVTNADKLRAMSDEELAEWYWWMLRYVQGYTDSHVALRDWLQKEASDG